MVTASFVTDFSSQAFYLFDFQQEPCCVFEVITCEPDQGFSFLSIGHEWKNPRLRTIKMVHLSYAGCDIVNYRVFKAIIHVC